MSLSRFAVCTAFGVIVVAIAAMTAACERTGGKGGQPRVKESVTGLPSRGLPEGWSAGDSVQSYTGQELFELIDGGADLFLEYGFVRSSTREYIGPEGALVIIGVYEMSGPDAAFGIFSAFRRIHFESLEIGAAGAISGYRLIFCKGPFFIDIQSLGGDEDQAAVRELARVAEASIPGNSQGPPAVLDRLPRRDLVPGSATLLHGVLGLNNSRYLSDRNLFGLSSTTPGVLGKYVAGGDPEPVQLLLVEYPDPQAASEVFSRLVEFYRQRASSRGGSAVSPEESSLVYADELNEEAVLLRGNTVYSMFLAPRGASLQILKQIVGG